ncbi:hypothetical protein Y5S_03082 [Alcanivorax nanhaiticus]|uniref:Lipoprotein n=1 Tax=Alcanivorax nanhaiticus TaxID=1177154 RepID=A0A095SH51_9GAMM|nr:hypothetical protein [Alcanivorax nanhaiticus]KGD63659.1 hypothetical protein Y5S_03082 [Alcanivorax nanhaiticus]
MRKASSLLLAVSITSGCANLGNPEQEVIEALDQQDYARAIQVIDSTPESHKQYPLLQEQYAGILQASDTYRQHLMQEAEAYGRRQQWADAFTLLQSNRSKVVSPYAIDELTASLAILEGRQLNELLAERRVAQAQAMLDSTQLSTTLANFRDSRAVAEKQQLDQEREQLIADLNRLGEYFAEQQKWMQARDLLRYAHQLAPDQPPSPQLARAQQVLNNADQRARAKRNQALQTEAEQLMARYQRNGTMDSLLAARRFLDQHKSNPVLSKHRDRLEQWSRRRFNEEMNTGEALYARGQYKEAYRIWKQLAPLYPNDEELNKKLERSRRVLSNLKSLQQS